ncbi:glycosyltransferase family 87 protein [Haloechinothrix sp. LS1_15]|uniref:glycosyltransferase family 87 protein n=1 Tax=Haloechinothrix sp. LS1_15 TaxID=2652248 RepID=UPI002945040A|nr:glycosyltransferase family 87 protein [Haloechinothrix sp. LS1_15]MDV6011278.1 DUF2029 domain-containing protein [Haloechinothrix sp. LS1_15]
MPRHRALSREQGGRTPGERALAAGALLPIGVVALALLLAWHAGVFDGELHDLQVYRFAVEAWRGGEDIYGLLPPTSAGNHLPFLYPPFAVAVFAPLAMLPWAQAVATIFAVNVVCVVATLYVVARRVWPDLEVRAALVVAAAALPPALLLEPLRETFTFGQVNLLLMGLVAVDCLAREPWWPRGIGVGLAAAIKLTPAAFLLFFLLRKDARASLVAVATMVLATAAGFLVDAGASLRYWGDGAAATSGFSGSPFLTNQTVEASLARYDLAEPAHTLLWLLLVAVLLAAVVLAMRRSPPELALLLNAALALLASPTSWSHHWVWVAPAVLVMAGYAGRWWQRDSVAALPWLLAATATATLFVLGPFHRVPGGDDAELEWTLAEQLLGNSYTWFTAALVIGYAVARALRAGSRTAG